MSEVVGAADVSAARIRTEQSLATLERWALAGREVRQTSELFELQ